jgi:hypothetical protein
MKGSLFRDRDFRLVAASVGVSALGDWVAIVALGLHVKDVTDSGFAVATLWICLFGPSVLVAGWAGLLVDRIEATRLLAGVSAVGAVAAVAVAFSSAVAPVLILTAALGVVFGAKSLTARCSRSGRWGWRSERCCSRAASRSGRWPRSA